MPNKEQYNGKTQAYEGYNNRERLTDIHTAKNKNPSSANSNIPVIDGNAMETEKFNHTESIWRVLLDVVGLLILLAGALVSFFIATPFERGFFCTDTRIRYPYKSDTVPTYVAVIVSVGTPIIFMWATEIIKFIYFNQTKKPKYTIGFEITEKKFFKIPTLVRNIYILTVIFGYGYLSTWVFTETSKNFLGSLRPYFMDVCIPSLNCSSSSVSNPFYIYLRTGIDFTCLGSDSSRIREARRSFISGHTSIMFYGCAFLIMYLHVAWSWRHLGIITHLLQTGLVVGATYVGYSRITDYHHHVEDVLGGAIVGSVVAFAAFRFILSWIPLRRLFLPYHQSKSHTKSKESYRSMKDPHGYWD